MGTQCSTGGGLLPRFRPAQALTVTPFPYTLAQLDAFNVNNVVACIPILYARAKRDAQLKRPPAEQLGGPYTIIHTAPDQPDFAVGEPASEILHLITEFNRRHKADPTHPLPLRALPAFSDVDFKSRFYCALLQARCVVVEGGPTFLNPVDEQQLVQWIKVPLLSKHLAKIVSLFNVIDQERAGNITARQLGTWFCSVHAGIPLSLLFPLLWDLVPRSHPTAATVTEFACIINHFCMMNEEELLRHMFDCLATSMTPTGERCIDLTTLSARYSFLPHPFTASDNVGFRVDVLAFMVPRLGVPSLGPGFEFCVEDCLLLQELQGVVDAQAGLTQPTLQGEEGGTDFTALNGNVEFAMFVAAKRRSPHILFSTRAVQTYLRGAMFGLKYWRKREKRLRHTAPVVLQDPTCPSTTALAYFSVTRHDTAGLVPLPFSLQPLTPPTKADSGTLACRNLMSRQGMGRLGTPPASAPSRKQVACSSREDSSPSASMESSQFDLSIPLQPVQVVRYKSTRNPVPASTHSAVIPSSVAATSTAHASSSQHALPLRDMALSMAALSKKPGAAGFTKAYQSGFRHRQPQIHVAVVL